MSEKTVTAPELTLEEQRALYKQHINRQRANVNSKIMALRRELHALDNCEQLYEEWYTAQTKVCVFHVKPDVFEMLTGVLP